MFQVGDGDFPALRVIPPQLIRLPAPANPLVGQERVVRTVRGALLERRLVTLTGVGGAGKTRLALEVGEPRWLRSHIQHGMKAMPVHLQLRG